MNVSIYENDKEKILRSKNYNFNFNKETGLFIRWGKDKDDDIYLGIKWCNIKDEETGKEFKERIEKELKKNTLVKILNVVPMKKHGIMDN